MVAGRTGHDADVQCTSVMAFIRRWCLPGMAHVPFPIRLVDMRLRAWLIRALGVSCCGAFGGYSGSVGSIKQRWCFKQFGHEDSCAFDEVPDGPKSQPNSALRQKFKGWT